MEIFSRFYERRLEGAIRNKPGSLPDHIVLIIAESDILEQDASDRIKDFVSWCQEYGITILTIYISLIDLDIGVTDEVYRELMLKISRTLKDMKAKVDIFSIDGKKVNIRNSEDLGMQINISLGYSGKKELTSAIMNIMEDVRSGIIKPEAIDESTIERHLLIKNEPDLVIRSGGKRLADFLIWQSVYSEIYFTDVSWTNLRKLDFLRAIRDFQKRQRRFGK